MVCSVAVRGSGWHDEREVLEPDDLGEGCPEPLDVKGRRRVADHVGSEVGGGGLDAEADEQAGWADHGEDLEGLVVGSDEPEAGVGDGFGDIEIEVDVDDREGGVDAGLDRSRARQRRES